MRRILGALPFLTVIPIKRRTTEPWKAAVFSPLVGALLGAGAALILMAAEAHLPAQLRTLLAGPLGVAAAVHCGWRAGEVLAAVTGVVVLTARWHFHRRIGGVTGDCPGATSQAVEMSLLGVLACQSCMW